MSSDEAMAAVAVIVPVYNRIELLRATIDSLRAQTLDNAQFVLVDDGSDAEVRSFLESLQYVDRRFRLIPKPDGSPRGAQHSRNTGLDAAVAEAVMFLDSDDLLEPNCLEQRVAFLASHPSTDIVIGHQAVLSGSSMKWVNVPRPGTGYLDRFLHCAGTVDVPWINGGVLIRLHRLRTLGIRWRPEFHWDDVAFHLECLIAGMTAVPMPADRVPDSFYRSHNSERYGTYLSSPAGIQSAAKMFEWINVLLEQSGLLTDVRRKALGRSFFHFCIRQPVDLGNPALAGTLLNQTAAGPLLTRGENARIAAYLAVANLQGLSDRLAANARHIAQTTFLRDFFPIQNSTFATIPVAASPYDSSSSGSRLR